MLKGLFLTMMFLSVHGNTCRNLCRQSRTYGLKSADCYNKDLKQVPQCLSTDIEVIDLSYNRIRKVAKDDLIKYSDVKILYLQENMITEIEEEALEDKLSLHTLDITYNAFVSIPSVIFHLPSLKKIYLSQNQNINIVNEIEKAKPIISPLEYFDVGFNELITLPNLGILPTLVKYNMSGNNGVKVSTKHFAGLCNLQILVNANTTMEFDDPCACSNLEMWLQIRKVSYTPFECDKTNCNYEIDEDDLATFDKCKEIHETSVLKSLILKIVIPTSIGLLLLIIAVGVYFYIRRKKQRRVTNNNKLHNVSKQLIERNSN